MLPTVLNDANLAHFRFWHDHKLQDGIHYQDELYYCLGSTPVQNRGKAYHLACQLAKTGSPVIISLTSDLCKLWAGMRTPLAQVVLSGTSTLDLLSPIQLSTAPDDDPSALEGAVLQSLAMVLEAEQAQTPNRQYA